MKKVFAVATVLTVYGIETDPNKCECDCMKIVATVLTVYGIETLISIDRLVPWLPSCNSTYRLRY